METSFYIGIIAAILTTSSFLPQVIKAHKTKKTGDLSLGMYLVFSVGIVFWIIFGIVINSIPVILANSIALIFGLYILFLKTKYG